MWKILIIDDNPDDRAACRRRLQRASNVEYLIEEADSGATGLAACQTIQPDCLLLDYRLPDLDGLQFLTRLSKQMGTQAPAVVMLTETGDEAVAVEAMKREAQDYLRKGMLTTENLGRAIANAIDKVTLRRALDAQRQRTSENEARLRLALAAAHMGTWEWNPVTGEIHFSPETEALWGLAPGTFAGTFDAFLAALHPDDRAIFHSPWKMKGDGVTRDLEYRIVLPDGTMRWVAVRGQMLADSEGKGRRAHGVMMDITARKQVETALRESEAKFATAFQLNPLPMALVTSEGRYVEVNAALEHSIGYTRAELQGRTSAELGFYLEPQREIFYDLLRREGHVYGFETTWLTKTGERRTYLTSAAPITLQGQRYLLAVNHDITDRKQAEAERERLLTELQRVNTELQQFSYIISHDLNEPLRTISNFITLLARRYQGTLDAEAHEYIAFAVEGAQRMQQMIQDLLAYTRAGQVPEVEAVDCESVLTRVVEAVQLRIAECGAVITHDPLPTVPGDATRLGQVFQNLISNALKFRGAAALQIHVSAQREGSSWRFAVRDNGIGIDPAQADRIFQVFQRLHTRGEYPGTGMGLSTCKKIIEQHGGRIWVESQPGEGAIFYFTVGDEGGENKESPSLPTPAAVSWTAPRR